MTVHKANTVGDSVAANFVLWAECRPYGWTGPRRETEYSADLDRLDYTDDADQPPFRRRC